MGNELKFVEKSVKQELRKRSLNEVKEGDLHKTNPSKLLNRLGVKTEHKDAEDIMENIRNMFIEIIKNNDVMKQAFRSPPNFKEGKDKWVKIEPTSRIINAGLDHTYDAVFKILVAAQAANVLDINLDKLIKLKKGSNGVTLIKLK